MDDYALRLYQEDENTMVELALHPARQTQPIAEMIRLPKIRLLSNGQYDGQLITANTEQVRSFEVYLNGYLINSTYYPKSGRFYFNDTYNGRRIFRDSFGLCTLTVRFKTGKITHALVSETFQIMVRSGIENFSVNNMAQIVARRHRMFLYGTLQDCRRRLSQLTPLQHSLEDRIALYRRLDLLMPDLLETLATRPVRKTEVRNRLSDPKTLMDLIRKHPESLAGATRFSGYRNAASRLSLAMPAHTNMEKQSPDTWENQVILAFLKLACQDIETLIIQIQEVISRIPTHVETRGEYLSTSLYMAGGIVSCLKYMKEDLQTIYERLSRSLLTCKRILPAREITLTSLPAPDHAFLSLPGYREIYQAMSQWFALRDVNAGDLRFATSFLRITEFYEIYVLAKLGTYFEKKGFELRSSTREQYERDPGRLDPEPVVNNVFVFEKGDTKITLYYQPVIYDQSHEENGITGLIRSTSLSFPRSWGEPGRGKFYTPDYLFKIERKSWKGARYILGDAKYTTSSNVRDYKLIPLIYRYLFSLLCKKADDRITGLYIFQGKSNSGSDSEPIVTSAYDLCENPHQIFPAVEMISFYEYAGVREDLQFEAFDEIFSLQLEEENSTLNNSFMPHFVKMPFANPSPTDA